MKARDIIPGWPRGRTTSSSSLRWRSGEFVYWSRIIRWREDGREDKIEEMHRAIAYHAAQQKMVTAYFEDWRTPKSPLQMRLQGIAIAEGE